MIPKNKEDIDFYYEMFSKNGIQALQLDMFISICNPLNDEIRINNNETITDFTNRCTNRILKETKHLVRGLLNESMYKIFIFIKRKKIEMRAQKQRKSSDNNYWYSIYDKVEKKLLYMLRNKTNIEESKMKDHHSFIVYMYYYIIHGYNINMISIFTKTKEIQWHLYWLNKKNVFINKDYTNFYHNIFINDGIETLKEVNKNPCSISVFLFQCLCMLDNRQQHIKQTDSLIITKREMEIIQMPDPQNPSQVKRAYIVSNLKSNLKRHMLKKTGIEVFICGRCSKEFSQETDLEIHNRVHTAYKRMLTNIKTFYSKKKDSIENKQKRLITEDNVKMTIYESIHKNENFLQTINGSKKLFKYMIQSMTNKNIFYLVQKSIDQHLISFLTNFFLVPTKYIDFKDIANDIWTPDYIFQHICSSYNKQWEHNPVKTLLSEQKNVKNYYRKETFFYSNVDISKISHKGIMIINLQDYLAKDSLFFVLRSFLTRLTEVYKKYDMTIFILSKVKMTKGIVLGDDYNKFKLHNYCMDTNTNMMIPTLTEESTNNDLKCLYNLIVKISEILLDLNDIFVNETLHEFVEKIYRFVNRDIVYSMEPSSCSKDAYNLQEILYYSCHYQKENKLIVLYDTDEMKLKITNNCSKIRQKNKYDMQFYFYVKYICNIIKNEDQNYEEHIDKERCEEYIRDQLQCNQYNISKRRYNNMCNPKSKKKKCNKKYICFIINISRTLFVKIYVGISIVSIDVQM